MFYDNLQLQSGDIFDYEDACIDEPQVEKAGLDTHLPEVKRKTGQHCYVVVYVRKNCSDQQLNT